MDKPKVRFLTVIWGARYIEEFARVSLPSYMAAGNLPALAEETDLEIVVLTASTSVPSFSNEPIFDYLRALCPVRFIIIDDLITTGNYGVTLTLAYARGIMDAGADQTNINFVFMNADFVLADGSLRTLATRLKAGERCIMAPSLRALSDQVVPQIMAAVDQDNFVLSMPPRQMVRLAFENLHPTVIAKTVTQNFVTCETHNQIYWQVDKQTLIARYHLIFMLAIKPELPLGTINSYCDYGFVPEMVPSGIFSILDNSDDFFMLELQPASQERNLLRSGGSTIREIASELGRWTTAEHRRYATVDIVFKAGEPSPRLPQLKHEAQTYFESLKADMPASAATHDHHFYWVMGLQAWASLKFTGATGPQVLPPEVTGAESPGERNNGMSLSQDNHSRIHGPPVVPMGERLESLLYRTYTALINKLRKYQGTIPEVPPWHHLWQDSRLIRLWLQAASKGPDNYNLLICETGNPLAAQMPKLMQFDVSLDPDHLDAFVAERREERGRAYLYETIFVQIRRANVRHARHIVESAQRYLKSNGTIAIFIWHENGELDPSNFSYELAGYTEDILPGSWLGYEINTKFAGGRLKRRLRRMERWVFGYLMPTTRRRIPLLIAACVAWPCVAGLTALNNILTRKTFNFCPPYCSSALVSLRRMEDATVETSIGSVRDQGSQVQ